MTVTPLPIRRPVPEPKADGRPAMPELFQNCVRETVLLGEELGLPANWCIPAAHTMRGALHALGYTTARVVGVRVAALNPAASRAAAARLHPNAWPTSARVNAIEGTDAVTDELWDGHAVVIVSEQRPGRSRKWLLDSTLGQLSNPAHDLHLGPLATGATVGFLACEPMTVCLPSGATVVYQQRPFMTGHHLDDGGTSVEYLVLAEMVTVLHERLLA